MTRRLSKEADRVPVSSRRRRSAKFQQYRARCHGLSFELLESRTLLTAASSPEATTVSSFQILPPLQHTEPGVTLEEPILIATAVGSSTPIAGAVTPWQMRQAYGVDDISLANTSVANPADGSGQTIAIVDPYLQPNIISDLLAFDHGFTDPITGAPHPLPDPPKISVWVQPGAQAQPDLPEAGEEISMDVEWAHAMAPGADIMLVCAASLSESDLYPCVAWVAQQPGVSVVSMSFGRAENGSTAESDFLTPAGHQGVTFIASSGDQKSGEDGDYPAFSPNVVAVGGTTFLTSPPQGGTATETVWNSGPRSRSGGGSSQVFSQPDYQAGVVTNAMRTIPDVAMDASSAAVYDTYDYGTGTGWTIGGGTSLSAPLFAGLVAVADQGLAAVGQGTLDTHTTLSRMYSAFRAGHYSSVFNDITQGNNGFSVAGPAYDLASGLGTPKAAFLVAALDGSIGQPTLTSPLDGATVYTTTPTLSWSSVGGATQYELIVYSSSFGSRAFPAIDVTIETNSYTPPAGMLPQGQTYEWQVRAMPPGGQPSVWSSLRLFTIPLVTSTLLGPSDNQGITSTTPTFTWSQVPGAAYYSLVVMDTQTNLLSISQTHVVGTSYASSAPLINGHGYTWQVYANTVINNVLISSPSTSRSFFVNVTGSETIVNPADGTVLTTNRPTFQWTPVGTSNYYLTLRDVSSGVTLMTDYIVGNTQTYTYPVPLISGHIYLWSVKAWGFNDSSPGAPASAEFRVAVAGATSLSTPVLAGPGGLVGTYQPTFQWSSTPGAAGYELYIFRSNQGNSSDFFPPIMLSGTSYTPSPLFPAVTAGGDGNSGDVYQWFVVAYDNQGDTSDYSPATDFAIDIANVYSGAPALQSPLGVTTTLAPAFQWAPIAGTAYYNVVIFDESIHAFVADAAVSTPYFILPGQLLSGHSYQWYVSAVMVFNGNSPASQGRFAASSLGIASLQPQGGPVATTTPTLDWSAVPDAAGYYVILVDKTTNTDVSQLRTLAEGSDSAQGAR